MKIAIIGAGIFGCTLSLILSKKNILLRYIKDVFSGKISNLENKKRSLFIIKTLNEIEKQLLKEVK